MDEREARLALVATMVALDRDGLNVNASGNASALLGGHLLVTPSGIPAGRLDPDDMVLLDLDGAPVRTGQRSPTSEWRLHTAVARARADVGAVVHTHAPESTAAATLGRAVPAVHYVVARFGGTELPCAPYATYGTDELARAVVETLGEHGTACLMANHGALAVGPDLEVAAALVRDVEWLCGVHRRARQQGQPRVLSADELARVTESFRTYGQPT